MANRFGAFAANALSFLVIRPLGYFLFGLLLIIYRRDPRAIAVFAAVGLAIAGLFYGIHLLLR